MARSERESSIRKPLTRILGVDSNLRVLRVLVRHRGHLAASEITRLSGLSRGSVRLGLMSLETMGIVTSSGSPHSRVYRFEEGHHLGPALEALFEAEKGRFAAILGELRRSAAGQPVLSLFIFGSAARGDDGPDSDLDIGVVAKAEHLVEAVETVRQALRKPAEKLGFFPNVVGLDLGDIGRLEIESDAWWRNVKEDAIVLSGVEPEVLALEGAPRG
jgi:predicted nucleotidyltransferase